MTTNIDINIHNLSNNQPSLNITDDAISYIERMSKKNQDKQKPYFRVAVEGGGCSGFQYAYSFDDQKPDDLVVEKNGIKILINPESMEFIKGGILDFYEDFGGSGLKVENPNATGSCGCGVSFSV